MTVSPVSFVHFVSACCGYKQRCRQNVGSSTGVSENAEVVVSDGVLSWEIHTA